MQRDGQLHAKEFFILIGLVLAVAVAAIWGYWVWNYPFASMRYEITVDVAVDGEMYTGSTVHEVGLGLQSNLNGGGTSGRSSFKGEAVAVDIADRGTLFMLLTGTRGRPNEPFSPEHGYHVDPQQLVNAVFEVHPSSIQAVRRLPDRVIDDDVPLNRLPMMVRFDDITDPTTVAFVNPFDLAASFGEGVELRRVQVQTTRARVQARYLSSIPLLLPLSWAAVLALLLRNAG